jgi:hypothetical protein
MKGLIFGFFTLVLCFTSFNAAIADDCGYKADGNYHCGSDCGYKADGKFHCGENCGYKSDGNFHCDGDN